MSTSRKIAETVDGYIALYPADVQERLERIRSLIREIAPEAQESISYAIPAYKLSGKPLIYFAGYANHISVYPLPEDPPPNLATEMAPYIAGKGTLRFSLRQPLPLDLIQRVVEHRMEHLTAQGNESKETG